MTLNDQDLRDIAYLLSKVPMGNTRLAERVEWAINNRLVALDRQRAALDMQTELFEEAKRRANHVSWHGAKVD